MLRRALGTSELEITPIGRRAASNAGIDDCIVGARDARQGAQIAERAATVRYRPSKS
jgi:hypothetical protein